MKVLDRGQREYIVISLNGKPRTGACDNRTLLADFIRHELGATGTHVGCEHGVCGACTVQVEGVAVRSCMMLAVQAEGLRVDTVEGLARDQEAETGMSDLQAAFKRHHALQCGFCTAGILMTCKDFLSRVPDPTEQQVRETLSGHLCRCTGYTNIVHAVLETARERLIKKNPGGDEADA
ncbi:(2Fe-2S)-binding protein [Bordetella bronchialis]|uniref:(2Fe-2S)-binding protein n=1 Tax=Bordetella bronchialis TaxID=463025 RepID=A0A193FTS5_9BORD|nr:(2Fe-2S)-binding protein [Bordetella bronchialis]ANN70449.1 (2Fe-2S)-binding protein [Bordetella bronchialis]